MSVSQIRNLGDRLRHSSPPSLRALELLHQLRLDYDAPLQVVERTLREHGMHATSRLKTVQTIVEKLVREKTRLSSMEDIAGARLVEDMNLAEQDERVERIRRAFAVSKVRDRRAAPSHGYRAVHVIVSIGDFPVEIQVRTRVQDLWAQSMEALAGLWGRQIQYGEAPYGADEGLRGPDDQAGPTRREVVEILLKVSTLSGHVEEHPEPQAEERLRRLLEDFVRAFRRVV